MEDCKISNLYNLDETIAKSLLEKYTYPWEVLPHIEEFILELGKTLNKDEYEQIGKMCGYISQQKCINQHILAKTALFAKVQR